MSATHDAHVSPSPICALVSRSSWEASILSHDALNAWRLEKVRKRPLRRPKLRQTVRRGHSITHTYVRIQATPFFSLKNRYGHGRTGRTIAAGPEQVSTIRPHKVNLLFLVCVWVWIIWLTSVCWGCSQCLQNLQSVASPSKLQYFGR